MGNPKLPVASRLLGVVPYSPQIIRKCTNFIKSLVHLCVKCSTQNITTTYFSHRMQDHAHIDVKLILNLSYTSSSPDSLLIL